MSNTPSTGKKCLKRMKALLNPGHQQTPRAQQLKSEIHKAAIQLKDADLESSFCNIDSLERLISELENALTEPEKCPHVAIWEG